MSNENQIRAKAVKDFVNLMIGALEAGFVDNNQPTLAEIHRVAQCHIKDTYGVESENIKDEWGEDVAKLCGLGAAKKERLLVILREAEQLSHAYFTECEIGPERNKAYQIYENIRLSTRVSG